MHSKIMRITSMSASSWTSIMILQVRDLQHAQTGNGMLQFHWSQKLKAHCNHVLFDQWITVLKTPGNADWVCRRVKYSNLKLEWIYLYSKRCTLSQPFTGARNRQLRYSTCQWAAGGHHLKGRYKSLQQLFYLRLCFGEHFSFGSWVECYQFYVRITERS